MRTAALKTLILYFTGTGNSLMVAKAIAEKLENAETIHVTKVQEGALDLGSDVLGFVFPVYWGGPPRIVMSTMPLLHDVDPAYTFAVATHAGDPKVALSHLRFELGKYGKKLDAGICLEMPSNYVLDYTSPTDASIRSDLARVDAILPSFVEALKTQTSYLPESDLPPFSEPSKSYQQFISTVNQSDEEFWVNDKCTECELCTRVCPVQNIEMVDGRPRWLHKCEQCLACINCCPVIAIQHGTRTEGRGRYTNPRIAVEELESVHT